MARAVQVNAIRGEPVMILLDGLTSYTKTLDFMIRRQPKLGRLEGEMVLQGKTKALVRYRPDPSMKGAVDTFTYAVKLEGSSSSEEAVVTINIVDPAPVLEISGGVDMGSILAGTAEEHSFTVRNSGNAAYRAAVSLPQGWAWVTPAGGKFEVAPGEAFNATVSVKTSKAGPVDEKVVLRGTTMVRFVGTSVAPVQAFPSLLQLTWDAAKRERAATLEVANNGNSPVTVKLSGPAEVAFPAEIAVGSQEKKAVTVVLSGKLDQPVAGTLKLDVPGWSQEVTFQAAVAPAVVTVTGAGPEGLVDFGMLDVAGLKTAEKTLKLHNVGGTPAVVRLAAPKFFNISGLADESVLAPGQETTLSIRPKTDVSGSLKDDWILGATGGDHALKLRAELDPEAMKKAMMSGVALAPMPPSGSLPVFEVAEKDRKELVNLLSGGVVPVNKNTDQTLPKVTAVRLVEAEPDRLLFEWKAPGEGTWTYRVLSMRLSKIPGLPYPVKDWDVMDNVKVIQNGADGRAEVTKLVPGARWLCRIVAIHSDGRETSPGEILTFFTPPVSPARWPWILLGVVAVGAMVYWVRRKWREDIKWQAS
ncbi:MAG: hypothetical protein V4726_04265 [Verrucomicrobiota bacterium]